MGQPRSGKSCFCQDCMRDHLISSNGFTLIDGKGTLYDDVLSDLAYVQPTNPIVLLNLTHPDFITPVDFFSLPKGADVGAHVADLTQTIVNLWGAANTDQTPSLDRMLKSLLTVAALQKLPLPIVAHLLEKPKKELREAVIQSLPDGDVKQHWLQVQYFSTLKTNYDRWLKEVGPTQTRLGRFIGSRTMRMFTGLPTTTTVKDWIDQKAIVLVKIAQSPNLSRESARVFAGLLLRAFLTAAMGNMDDPKPYFLYCDEAQQYVTSDLADMLDLTVASGLRVTVIHHHLDQPPFNTNIHLRSSLDMNAPIKVIFEGLSLSEKKRYAEDWRIHELNQRHKKEDRFTYVTDYTEEGYETTTETSGEIPGGSTHSTSTSFGTRLIPSARKERTGQDDYTREEVLSQLTEQFYLKRQQCMVKLPTGAFRYTVPQVEEFLQNPRSMLAFLKALQSTAIPLHEADQILETEERKFLERGNDYESKGGRPKKRPARLHPQG